MDWILCVNLIIFIANIILFMRINKINETIQEFNNKIQNLIKRFNELDQKQIIDREDRILGI